MLNQLGSIKQRFTNELSELKTKDVTKKILKKDILTPTKFNKKEK